MAKKNEEKYPNGANVLQFVMMAVPYPEHVSEIKIRETFVDFTWRSTSFRVDFPSLMTMENEGSTLCGSDASLLMEALLKRAMIADLERRDRYERTKKVA